MAGGGASSGAAGGPVRHRPVLLREVLSFLTPKDGGCYLDGTFGAGGHTRAILEIANCRVLGLDRDRNAIADGAALAEAMGGRLVLAEERFSNLDQAAEHLGFAPLDGVLLDLGVSSMQLDQPERGFSFRGDGPLDMRMGRSGPTAAEIVNTWPEAELARVFATLGEERRARAVARAIVRAREGKRIERTGELAEIVRRVVRARPDEIDPATRTFQALRLLVNEELQEVALALHAAERVLKPGGRLVVISFHSLEDRIVKTFFTARGKAAAPSRHLPETERAAPTFSFLMKKPAVPSAEEIRENPRARSAKLRAAERTEAAPGRDDPLAPLLAKLPSLDRSARGRRG
ncbi:MAG: 16S rRNA (cytosine(1402)-N(4))-methyltransferase RsmH [Bradyrhizobiaceae bacterium]|nr:16S rRNA (cytosine(1402)-N(4))-methyltransferase RsmH [Bradyrhizobiaceae bacterium]